jgi:cell division protein FtsI (penicillin-binding protein 3)/stage V sporulation protein D (sporulation-specific penicillin-binding protein)
MSKGFASNYRMVLLATGISLSFCGIAGRLVWLHVLERDQLLKYLDQARRSFVVENARRGNIRAARGELLATSRTLLDIGLDPHMLRPEDEARWPDLARLLGIKVEDIRAAAARRTPEASDDDGRDAKPVQWVKLAEGVDESVYEGDPARQIPGIKDLKIRGVYGNRVYRRFYPQGSLAAHAIGYVNQEEVPAAGVEHYMDFFLRGRNGWRESERDGRRQELAQFRTREVPPVDGYDVVLSLDTYVQHVVENELQTIANEYQPAKATIIVSDAHTGFLLGMANYPTFNLNEYNKAPIDSLRNFAVADVFEPGSTFKIVAASGALNERLVTPSTTFDCSLTEIDYHNRHLHLPKEAHNDPEFQNLSVAGIISHSSNRGAAQLAMRLGDQRFYDYVCAFGFGKKTGFPFGGEVDGILEPPKQWNGLTITRMPMGQSIAVTPMQIHYAMGTIANGGILLQPQLFREVRDEHDALVFTFAELPRRRVISESTAQTMARLLMGVASSEGTAPEAAIPHFEVAGKTGTSQKIIDGKYSTTHHVASFVGFFPASRPRVVISVIVDDADAHCPRGVAYGNKVAAPSFKHIAEQLIQYLDIKPVDPIRSYGEIAMQTASRR